VLNQEDIAKQLFFFFLFISKKCKKKVFMTALSFSFSFWPSWGEGRVGDRK
jgi:hypothetical protein